jgi:hypothetical protein
MATIIEVGVGADGRPAETYRSEHSGRTVTSGKLTTLERDQEGNVTGGVRYGEAHQAIWDHENEDYADDRDGLGVEGRSVEAERAPVEDPAPAPAGGVEDQGDGVDAPIG